MTLENGKTTGTRYKQQIPGGFRDIRGTNGHLLFRYDPERELIEVKPKGGQAEVIDLRKYTRFAREPPC